MTRTLSSNRLLLVALGAVVVITLVVFGIVRLAAQPTPEPAPVAQSTSTSTSAAPASPMSAPATPPPPATTQPVSLAAPTTASAAAEQAFINALSAIDRDIVHGKPAKALDRGRNQCQSVAQTPGDEARLLRLAEQRFTSPDHPQGFGPDTAKRILTAVRTHLCPAA
ncbi:hypothetical protein [Actinosynnema sp. ALI-1.44]|uniref:hypothetical protein n=1 Tax=Actinosynnema sp. ALI-1.44 TaxID=1933779 RepID=UPI001178BF84|nr:hypothetical protein [Actinosynnema sp. ALI-1.44]